MTKAHRGSRPALQPLRHPLPWITAAAVLAIETTVLALTPTADRAAVSTTSTGVSILALALVMRHAARRTSPAASIKPSHPATDAAPSLDPDAPSASIALAYELARRGVPPTWIAARCAIPAALAQLIAERPQPEPGTDNPQE